MTDTTVIDYGKAKIKAKKFIGEVDGSVAAADVSVVTFTTAGGTEISGTLQEVLEALGDLADPT